MISIIVPTHQHLEDLLKPCLTSLIKYTDLTDVEVIVVANGCTDKTKEYVESLGFKLVWFDEALGFTRATNEGIKVAKGEYIVFLNNDTVLLPQEKNTWLRMLIDPLKDDVGVTGPLMSYSPHAERSFLIFFCAATRKDVIDKVGFLNEIYNPGGGEDTEFCIEAENLGFKLLQVPGDQLKEDKNLMVGSFPIYHKAESTMLDANHAQEWYRVVERNSKLLKKYKLPDGYFYGEDIKEYRRLVEEVPNGGTICELGTWKGRSLCSIADLIKRKHLKVIAIDTFEGTVVEDAMRDTAKKEDIETIFRENVKGFGLEPTIYRMTTDEASRLVEDKSLDLCFIDADHTYEGVKNDLEHWEQKVKGTIAGHDYNGMAWPGVKKAVDERYKDITYNGISIVWSKKL